MVKRFEPKFPHGQHDDCRALTQLTIDHLPHDGSIGRSLRFSRGADVWQADDRADRLYFLLRGEVVIIAGDSDGRELLLRMVRMGEPFGEVCFCGGKTERRRDTARAAAESIVVEVRPDDLLTYVQQDRGMLSALVTTFCLRLGEAERRIEVLATRSAEQRLARLLLHLATPQGTASTTLPREATLILSHDELARMASLSRQQVTLTLGGFRRLGLVRYDRSRPLTVNIQALSSHLNLV